MEEDLGHINTFDAYLSGEMAADEKSNFELQLKTDSRLNLAFEEYKKLKGEIELAYEYTTFKEQLKNLPEENSKQKSIFLQPKFYMPLSIAALIAIIVLTVNPFKFESGDMAMETKSEDDLYSPTATVEETEASLDSTSIETESNYKISESDDTADTLRGNAVFIHLHGLLVTTINIPETISEVKLSNDHYNLFGKIIYRNPQLGLSFVQIKNEYNEFQETKTFKLSNDETLQRPEIKLLCYQEKIHDTFKFHSINSQVLNYYNRKNDNQLNIKFNPEYIGGAVIDLDNKLVGIVSNKKNKDKSVTYFISSYYIGIELDKLFEEHPELKTTMKSTHYIETTDNYLELGTQLVFAVYY